jgi:hypothetical protein
MSLPPEFFEQEHKGGRGRPVTSWALSMSTRIAFSVANVQARLGKKRGTQAEAIRLVALRRGMTIEGVKKAVKRAGALPKKWVNFSSHTRDIVIEIDRRTTGFPDTIKDFLCNRLSPITLVDFLREHNINGECPQWLLTAYFDAKEK